MNEDKELLDGVLGPEKEIKEESNESVTTRMLEDLNKFLGIFLLMVFLIICVFAVYKLRHAYKPQTSSEEQKTRP
jgi:hypothetical protein